MVPPVRYVSRVTAVRYAGEAELLHALRNRDDAAFVQVVDAYGAGMLRVAALYVRDRAVAQEVVQDAWVAFMRGIDRFEGRSSLRTWLFSILVNIAKTRGVRESRSVPFSALAAEDDADEPSVPAERFRTEGEAWAGHWAIPPVDWDAPLQGVLSAETRSAIAEAVEQLPLMQRRVLSLRDIEGWSSEEVCNVLDLSETNQRVLLHRARSKLRELLDHHVMSTVP
jgi:RNA polymerase sigma-70 factor (ECF subfamily)